MTTERESDERVRRHAETLTRRGVGRSDAIIQAAALEAEGKLNGVQRVKRATADMEMMSDPLMPFHVKIARCAGTPTNEVEELAKALRATETALRGLQADVEARRRKKAEAAATISPRAGKMPLQSFPRKRPGRPPAATPAPARAMLGPSRQEHIDGRHFDHYWQFRDRLAGDIRAKKVRPTPEAIISHSVASYGLDASDAAEWCERFMDCVNRDLERRRWPDLCGPDSRPTPSITPSGNTSAPSHARFMARTEAGPDTGP
jgi:hypothetical protein